MNTVPYRILIYEDDQNDARLVASTLNLSNGDYNLLECSDKESLLFQLEEFKPDLIISDYHVPGFNGLNVLKKIREEKYNIPVLIMSGLNDRKVSMECLQAGAWDFLNKEDMHRLPYILRNLHHKLRNEIGENGDKVLFPSLNYGRYKNLFNSLSIGLFLYNPSDLSLVDVNDNASGIFGYSRDELLHMSFDDLTASEFGYTSELALKYARKALLGEPVSGNWKVKGKNEDYFWINVNLKLIDIEGVNYLMASIKDIDDELKTKQKLESTKSLYESLAQNTPDIIMRFDKEYRHLYVNNAITIQLGLKPEIFLGKTHKEMGIFKEEMCDFWEESIEPVFKNGRKNIVYFCVDVPAGEKRFEWRLFPEFDANGDVETVLAIARDTTERVKNEKVQKVLFEIANAANQTSNLEELFLMIQKSLSAVVDTKNCYVALYNEDTDKLSLPFHKDEKDSFNEFPAGKTTTGYVIRTRKSQLLDASMVEELERKGEIEPIGAPSVSWLGVPLKMADTIIGVFVVQSYDDSIQYTEDDVQLLEFVSDQIARVIERKVDHDNLKHNEERQRRIIESSPDGLVVIDLMGSFLEVNSKFYELTGETAAVIRKKVFFDYISDGDVIKVQNMLNDTLSSGYAREMEFRMKKKDGKEFFAEASLGLIKGNEKMDDSFVIVVKDIHERKQYEHNLKIAKDKAEESDRLKTAFLSNMSHEIRTPMNAIVGFSELLSASSDSEEDKTEFITQINMAADSLLHLIDDILDISKIESGQLQINPKWIMLSPMIHELHPLFKNSLQNYRKEHLELKKEMPEGIEDLQLFCDEYRLRQIFINLVNNAIKFTEMGEISYGIKSFGSNSVECFVRDTGIGISKEKLDLIFERFMQGHDRKDKFFGGTGLGLAISRSLIEQMGGNIRVKSVEGEGSEFTFTLPLPEVKRNKDYVKLPDQLRNFSWEGHTILIAEDENSNFLLLKEMLRKTGVKIVRALNGIEALDQVRSRNDIDLVLMDVQMPLLNGYEATRKIRDLKIEVPVIAQTAYAMAGERELSIFEGCNDFISKPIRVDELYEILSKYLGKK